MTGTHDIRPAAGIPGCRAFPSRVLAILVGCILSAAATFAQTTGRFDSEIAAFEAQDRLRPPPANPVVFTGSSSIRAWPNLPGAFPEHPVMNRGFGGSEMSDLLHYLDRVVFAYRPAAVVVYEGDNDLASGKSPSSIEADYSRFLQRTRAALPNTRVVLLAVKPSPIRIGLITAQRDLNRRLQALAEADPAVDFVDVFTPMLDEAGAPRPELYLSDRLHMTRTGYDLWEFILAGWFDSWTGAGRETVLVDFGPSATAIAAGPAPNDPVRVWNNVTTELGTVPGSILPDLRSVRNEATGIRLVIEARFNAANSAGTTRSTAFPARATQDSLFGNREPFGGLAEVNPVLRLEGLDSDRRYTLQFYASRTFATDNRETLYRVTGTGVNSTTLNASNNEHGTAILANLAPDSTGSLRIEVLAGPANDNANHFTYLGALSLSSTVSGLARLDPPTVQADSLRLGLHGTPGRTYAIEVSGDLLTWVPRGGVRVDAAGVASITLPLSDSATAVFVRAVEGE